ncbi:MAG: FkbM family methyltransferase [Deltaproteobacteria bacterium]|nr:FkbM family methyltransferase [Deltaproteobacteria bacterium]
MLTRLKGAVKDLQRLATQAGSPVAKVAGPLEERVRSALLEHAPLWLWRYREWRGDGVPEEELAHLASFTDPAREAADIGASDGWYTYHLLRHTRFVHAFEPQPSLARKLAYELRTERVRVEQTALSDQFGTAKLRIPRGVHQRSTIEAENPLEDAGEVEELEVPLRPFDSFHLSDLGFVKIDVEGHELAVLQGATQTLATSHPVVLIEVEERHKSGAVQAVRQFLEPLGYAGWFFLEGRLVPISTFDPALHQDPRNLDGAKKLGTYANNFLYLQPEHEAKVAHLR